MGSVTEMLQQGIDDEREDISDLQKGIETDQNEPANLESDIAQQQANQDAAAAQFAAAQQDNAPDPNGGWDPSSDPLSPAPANDPVPDPNGGRDPSSDPLSPAPANDPSPDPAPQDPAQSGDSETTPPGSAQDTSGGDIQPQPDPADPSPENTDPNMQPFIDSLMAQGYSLEEALLAWQDLVRSEANSSNGRDNAAGAGAAIPVIIFAILGTLAAVAWAQQRLQSMQDEGREPDALDYAAYAILAAGGGPPKPSPNFEPPTNPPQLPPDEIPEGWRVRTMPPTEQYPNGYWRLEKPMANGGWQGIDPSTMKPGTQAQTHIPLPPPE